jgi:hypothetical protein
VNLFFLPFVRQGLTPAANAGARANVSVSFRLESAGQPARDAPRTLALAGPATCWASSHGRCCACRRPPGRAEPDFFPLIEFDAPELPWAWQSDAAGRIAPRPGSC